MIDTQGKPIENATTQPLTTTEATVAHSRPKIIVILTSVILLAGMLFVPAKQVERAPAPNQ
jgi:hypothetical protein